MSSWVLGFTWTGERKVQIIIKNLHIRKREAATNLLKPRAHTDQLCSLFHQDTALADTVPAQAADTWPTPCSSCAGKWTVPWKPLPMVLLTFILGQYSFDSRLPCLYCQELHWLSKAGHQSWSEEPPPWVLRTSPGSVSSLPLQLPKSDLPLTRSSLLLLEGWASPPTWWQQKTPVKSQKNKPYLYPVNTLRMDREPARNQVLLDIPKAWDYTWMRQESFPSEQDCAKEKFFFLLRVQDLMISSSFHFLKCRVRA